MTCRRSSLVVAVLATLVLAGCGSGGVLPGQEESKPNATDAAFARAMVVHERATRQIAKAGRRAALREELRAISGKTVERADRDLPLLAAFADEMRRRRVTRVGAGIGEPPPLDARRLRRAVSFDYEFLTRMITQHEYTVAAAAAQRARGGDPRLRELAAEMHEAAQRDLEQLRRWLRQWYEPANPGVRPPDPGGGGGGGPSPGPEV